ncbi:HAD family hydrolase [Robertmurraya kyonggiensis]|nr:HAD family hydrolase [Robertmurraya kyonggiensis]
MIFVSDLDRTLIYSKRALAEHPVEEEIELVSVEKDLEKDLSFMTNKSLEYLRELSSKLLFVPVTTRSIHQFQRVSFHDGISHKYAVTSNGANIFCHGQLLTEWNKCVTKEMKESSVPLVEVITLLKERFNLKDNLRIMDDLFIYYFCEERVTRLFLEELTVFLTEIGWRVSYQGRKLYVVPATVSKGKAVKFIQEREDGEPLIGAGDSLLDDEFLRFCDSSFILGHGELAALHPRPEDYHVIQQLGIKGGEELLKTILDMVDGN